MKVARYEVPGHTRKPGPSGGWCRTLHDGRTIGYRSDSPIITAGLVGQVAAENPPIKFDQASPPHPAGTAEAPGSLKDFAQILLKCLLRDASLFYFTLTRD